MANKGLEFEWCIYHLIAKQNPLKFKSNPDAIKAAQVYKSAGSDVKEAAENAVANIKKEHGKINDVIKKSGGGKEPKTDLIIRTAGGTLKCSLKFEGSVQLSSGGIKNTSKFLKGVVSGLSRIGKLNKNKAADLLHFLGDMEGELGNLGSLPKAQAEKALQGAKEYNERLQEILGTRRQPDVSKEYIELKKAIVEEALTGKYSFADDPDCAANYILSGSYVRKINSKYIDELASRTSVRMALKGRGTKEVRGRETRMNEVVIRFDTV